MFTLLYGASKGFVKPFEALKRSEKIKTYVNFLCLGSGGEELILTLNRSDSLSSNLSVEESP